MFFSPCDTIMEELCRKEGDAVKKVMLLASENMCGILQSALDGNYRTLPCSDPADGRTLLQSEPDALILELSLPGADGLAFLNEIAGVGLQTILVLTPFISDHLLHQLENSGVCAALRIPFRLSCLEQLLSEQL